MQKPHYIEIKADEELYARQSSEAYGTAEAEASKTQKYPVVYPHPYCDLGCGWGRVGQFVEGVCKALADELKLDWECCHQTSVQFKLFCGTPAQYAQFENELLQRLKPVAAWTSFTPSC